MRRSKIGPFALAICLLFIAAIFSAATGEDYHEQVAILFIVMIFFVVLGLDDKADELLGDLPAKVLECPYGYGKCEPHPSGLKPCGREEPEVTQPLPKVGGRD